MCVCAHAWNKHGTRYIHSTHFNYDCVTFRTVRVMSTPVRTHHDQLYIMQVLLSGTNAPFVTNAALKLRKERKKWGEKGRKALYIYCTHNQKQVKSERQKAHFTLRPVQEVCYLKCLKQFQSLFRFNKHQSPFVRSFGGNMYQAFIPVILNILTVCSRTQRKPETLEQIKCGH